MEEEPATEVITAVVMARAITTTRLLTMQHSNVASRTSAATYTVDVHTTPQSQVNGPKTDSILAKKIGGSNAFCEQ